MSAIGVKNLLIIGLLGACLALAYRVLDLGITLSYSSVSVEDAHKEVLVVRKFQRMPCSVIDEINDDSVFRKDGLIVISGFEFECKVVPENSVALLHYVGRK